MAAEILLTLTGFAVGMGVLVKTSDIAVDLAVKFSNLTGMTRMAVGMIILAFMTSMPELSITLTASISGASKIMFSNLVGSNIANLLLVMGTGAVFYKLAVEKEEAKRGTEIMLVTGAILLYGMFYGFDFTLGMLSLIVFGFLSKWIMKNNDNQKTRSREDVMKAVIIFAKLFAVILVILASAELVTLTAKEITSIFGITQTFIGATLIALSTSLPELSITLSAGKKGEYNIQLGNIFGSCFINIALILGIGMILTPVSIGFAELVLVSALFATNFIMYFSINQEYIDRFQGVVLLSMYILFIIIMALVA